MTLKTKNDTICAISSPPGRSGIGIIRVSGPQTYQILSRLFRDKKGKRIDVNRLPSHTVKYGFIVEGDTIRDEVLLTVMRKPKSYTREDMAEIGCHGGFASLKAVLRALINCNCRLAEPGEFTKRAFLSGRIDLVQAEAVLALVNSRTEKGLSAALDQIQGKPSGKMDQLESLIIDLLAEIDAEIEFPEELIHFKEEHKSNYREKLAEILQKAESILQAAEAGKVLNEGLKLAILGRPNVGKSSLLNALLSEERAIVTEIPGTTRDEISEWINVAGFPLKVIDTAGIREPKDKIEEAGVRRSRAWIKAADLILLVVDRSEPLQPDDERLLSQVNPDKTILVINKEDLPDRLTKEEKSAVLLKPFTQITVSCLKGWGIRELERMIGDFIREGRVSVSNENPVFLALEQEISLKEAIKSLRQAERAFSENLPLEFIAADLKRAAGKLGEVSGHQVSEEVLNQIFSRFCLGK